MTHTTHISIAAVFALLLLGIGAGPTFAVTPGYYVYSDDQGNKYSVQISDVRYRMPQPNAIDIAVQSCEAGKAVQTRERLSQTSGGLKEAWKGEKTELRLEDGWKFRHGEDVAILQGPMYRQPC